MQLGSVLRDVLPTVGVTVISCLMRDGSYVVHDKQCCVLIQSAASQSVTYMLHLGTIRIR